MKEFDTLNEAMEFLDKVLNEVTFSVVKLNGKWVVTMKGEQNEKCKI